MAIASSGLAATNATAIAARVDEAAARPLPATFFGFNLKFYEKNLWHDDQWSTRVQALRPGLIRYPGGGIANYWDWRRGTINEDVFPRRRRRGPAPKFAAYPLADLVKATKKTGAEPLFCLNMLHSSLEDQLAMLDAAAAAGLPIRFVELGNEFYMKRPDYRERFPNGTAYAKEAARWIAAIKKKFPGAQCAIVGALETLGNQSPRNAAWNREVFAVATGADAVTLHPYVKGAPAAGPPQRRQRPAEGERERPKEGRSEMSDRDATHRLLAAPFRRLQGMRDETHLPGQLRWWLTEYNIIGGRAGVTDSWAHGLAVAAMLAGYLQEERIDMALYHQLAGARSFCAIYDRAWRVDYAAGGHGSTNDRTIGAASPELPPPAAGGVPANGEVRTKPYAYSAAGRVLQVFGRAMTGGGRALEIQFAPRPIRTLALYGEEVSHPTLLGWVFAGKAGDRRQAVLVNLDATAVLVDLSALGLAARNAHILSAAPSDPILDDDPPRTVRAPVAEPLRLPPYSVAGVYADEPPP